jgi:hypothetical protein
MGFAEETGLLREHRWNPQAVCHAGEPVSITCVEHLETKKQRNTHTHASTKVRINNNLRNLSRGDGWTAFRNIRVFVPSKFRSSKFLSLSVSFDNSTAQALSNSLLLSLGLTVDDLG